jgi:hypothetical protein
MSQQTHLYDPVYRYLQQGSEFVDKRHLQVLSWIVTALLGCQRLNPSEWEPYVTSRAEKAQSYQRRWSRFFHNSRVVVSAIYGPLVMAAIRVWQSERLYLAMDTTLLWEEYCLVTLSVVCAGRAVPFDWIALKHRSASVGFSEYQPLLEKTHQRLKGFSHVTLLADRGFANHDLVRWLKGIHWHWYIRVPGDTTIHYRQRRRTLSREVRQMYPPKGEATFYRQVKLWDDGELECHLALARLKGVKEAWAVITDETPSLETFWRYGLRFRTEELYLDSKSGVFELERSKIRNAGQLDRLYLGAAIAILFATLTGMTVQKQGQRQQVDPHWKRGLSYLKIGLRWLTGVVHKGRHALPLSELLLRDPARCFASRKAKETFFNQFFFSRVRTVSSSA